MPENDLYVLAKELSKQFTKSKYKSFLVINEFVQSDALDEFDDNISGFVTKEDFIRETFSLIDDWERFIEWFSEEDEIPSESSVSTKPTENDVFSERMKTISQKGSIFISYRRVDSEGYAGRIYDRLAPYFGDDAIFMDVDDIPAGVDFVKFLENEVQSCDVLIALIGRQWLNVKDENGKRRLADPEDFVRIEIATALKRDIRVIPVLLGGTQMPQVSELPDNLQALTRRNGLPVYHHSFHTDTNRLIKHLEDALAAAERARKEQQEEARKEKEDAEKVAREKAKREAEEKAKKEKEEREKAEAEERTLVAAAEKDQKEQEEREQKEREEKARKEREAREAAEKAEQERIAKERREAEEKARLEKEAEEERDRKAAAEKARQGRIDNIKKLFSKNGKYFLFFGSSIALIFLFGYIISNVEFPTKPELTKTPTISIPATATVQLLISTSLPTSANSPTENSSPTKMPSTPTPELGVGITISPKDGMVMVYVPSGEFEMGSENGDDDERPVHSVYLDSFWISQNEVTNAMYSECVSVGACREPYKTAFFYNDEYANHPVTYISWNNAEGYCKWIGTRLPTEAEWEYAARGGLEGKDFPWGDLEPVCTKNVENGAKFDDNDNCNYAGTEPVGSYAPNGYWLYDLAGNVWEWVADWYDDEYYNKSPYSNPLGPDEPTIAGCGYGHIVRGGSWLDRPDVLSVYNRQSSSCFFAYGQEIGFRCALSASE